MTLDRACNLFALAVLRLSAGPTPATIANLSEAIERLEALPDQVPDPWAAVTDRGRELVGAWRDGEWTVIAERLAALRRQLRLALDAPAPQGYAARADLFGVA